MKKPLVLCICDGMGIAPAGPGNAVTLAKTPKLDKLMARWPKTQLSASGPDVGLPTGQMGNSEVGHTNIGAGRIVYQDLTRISKAIDDGVFFENPVLKAAMDLPHGRALHLFGLLSGGGVHSHTHHLFSLLEMAKRRGVERLYIHCFMDGRDVLPTSGAEFMVSLLSKTGELGVGKVATVMGRYFAMDRDKRWNRVQKAYVAMAFGAGEGVENREGQNPAEYIQQCYEKGVTDEFLPPAVFDKDGMVQEGDSVIFYNFRPDRAREITRAFVDPAFDGFPRQNGYLPVRFCCMTEYDATMPNVAVAFPEEDLTDTFGQALAAAGKTQLRIAETEKYPHVTFFFNGGSESAFAGENRILIPSPKVATYDLQPQMSAPEVADALLAELAKGELDVVILNFANCDMVGHTGVLPAAVQAVEAVDTQVGRVAEAVLAAGGVMLLTADHGNAEQMQTETGAPFTAHTTNPVPFLAIGSEQPLREGGRLCDIAPTMLQLLGLSKPVAMTGESLFVHTKSVE